MASIKKQVSRIICILLIGVALASSFSGNTIYAQSNNKNTAEQEKHNQIVKEKSNKVKKLITQLKRAYIEKNLLLQNYSTNSTLNSRNGIEMLNQEIISLETKLVQFDVKKLTNEEVVKYEVLNEQSRGNSTNSFNTMTVDPYPNRKYESFYMNRWVIWSNGIQYNVDMMYAIPTSTSSSLSRAHSNTTLYTNKQYTYNAISKILKIYSEKLTGAIFSYMGPIFAWSPYELFMQSDNKIVNNKLEIKYLDSMSMCYHYVKKLSQPDSDYFLTLTTNSIDVQFLTTSAGINQYGTIITASSGWESATFETDEFGSADAAVIAANEDRGGMLHSVVESYTFSGPLDQSKLKVSIYVPLSPLMIK